MTTHTTTQKPQEITVYYQHTTGTTHRSRTCGVLRRTRYEPEAIQVTLPLPSWAHACKRCWREL